MVLTRYIPGYIYTGDVDTDILATGQLLRDEGAVDAPKLLTTTAPPKRARTETVEPPKDGWLNVTGRGMKNDFVLLLARATEAVAALLHLYGAPPVILSDRPSQRKVKELPLSLKSEFFLFSNECDDHSTRNSYSAINYNSGLSFQTYRKICGASSTTSILTAESD